MYPYVTMLQTLFPAMCFVSLLITFKASGNASQGDMSASSSFSPSPPPAALGHQGVHSDPPRTGLKEQSTAPNDRSHPNYESTPQSSSLESQPHGEGEEEKGHGKEKEVREEGDDEKVLKEKDDVMNGVVEEKKNNDVEEQEKIGEEVEEKTTGSYRAGSSGFQFRRKTLRGENLHLMPKTYVDLFEQMVYAETVLFCLIISYAILHLPVWGQLYGKLMGGGSEPEASQGHEEPNSTSLELQPHF